MHAGIVRCGPLRRKTEAGSPAPRLRRYAGLSASRLAGFILRSASARSRKAGVGIEPAYTDLQSDHTFFQIQVDLRPFEARINRSGL